MAASRTDVYFPDLQGKRLGLMVNHTSTVNGVHLVDTLLASGMSVEVVFAPEHGFRGDADAGAVIGDGVDDKTGVRLLSLYGGKYKPDPEDLSKLDLVIFDIQDVGARFYTYVSSMTYLMEACAEQGVPFMVLDRPNPLGYYVDGRSIYNPHAGLLAGRLSPRAKARSAPGRVRLPGAFFHSARRSSWTVAFVGPRVSSILRTSLRLC